MAGNGLATVHCPDAFKAPAVPSSPLPLMESCSCNVTPGASRRVALLRTIVPEPMAVLPSAASWLTETMPASINTAPLKVFGPVSQSVPVPSLSMPPDPTTTALMTKSESVPPRPM